MTLKKDILKPWMIYVAEPAGDSAILTERGDLARVLEEARLWRLHEQERVFFCDQCTYFNESAQAVQDHNERDHDCYYETYYTTDRYGPQISVHVRTIKCHNRETVKESKPLTPFRRAVR